MSAIDRDKYDVLPIGISPNGHWVLMPDDAEPLRLASGRALPQVPESSAALVLPLSSGDKAVRVINPGGRPTEPGSVDVIFPLLHGPFGEDGTVQGLFDLADIRYVGCGVTSSAIMMDKAYMKLVFAAAGLEQVPYVVITNRDWMRNAEAALARCMDLQFPVFVKPCRAGSSMGVERVSNPDDLRAAVERAREHDPKVIVEEGLVGAREIECGVLDSRDGGPVRVSPVGEVKVMRNHDFYDFEAKYFDEDAIHIDVPADIPTEVAAEVERIARVAFEAADCEGLARVDCFYTRDGRVLISEINTMPGFTPFSMFPQVWAAAGFTYRELIDELIQLALARQTGLR